MKKCEVLDDFPDYYKELIRMGTQLCAHQLYDFYHNPDRGPRRRGRFLGQCIACFDLLDGS
jgi:hypothetical protein